MSGICKNGIVIVNGVQEGGVRSVQSLPATQNLISILFANSIMTQKELDSEVEWPASHIQGDKKGGPLEWTGELFRITISPLLCCDVCLKHYLNNISSNVYLQVCRT